MPEQVYELQALRDRALQVLRARGTALPVGTVASEMGVPLWAADRGLEAAYEAGLATFEGGVGWQLAEPAARATVDDGAGQAGMFEGD